MMPDPLPISTHKEGLSSFSINSKSFSSASSSTKESSTGSYTFSKSKFGGRIGVSIDFVMISLLLGIDGCLKHFFGMHSHFFQVSQAFQKRILSIKSFNSLDSQMHLIFCRMWE